GPVEYEPLRFGNRALIADGERDQHTGIRLAIERLHDARANRFTRSLNVIVGSSDEGIEKRVACVGTDVSGGAKIVLEEPRFQIEAGRIDIAVWSLEPYRQRPAFASVHGGNIVRVVILRAFGVPTERNVAG